MKLHALLLGVSLFVGCGMTGGDDPNAIRIAVVLPLTGTFAANGEPHRAAIQMAFRDLENAGGVRGRSVRAELIDCGDNKDVAVGRVNTILGSPEAAAIPVRAVISSSTACHEASLLWALQARVPHLEVSSGSDQEEIIDASSDVVTPANLDQSYEFQVRALCNVEAEMTPGFIAQRPEMRRVVLMRGSHTHDVMHTTTVRAQFPLTDFASQGGVIVNPDDIVVPNDGPYQARLAAALALNPDTIYFHLNGDTRNLNFLGELKRSGFQGKIVTCGMVRKPIVLDPVTPGYIDYLGGRLFFMMRGPVGGSTLTTFKDDFKTFYGKDADTFAASAYDAAMLTSLGLAATPADTGASLRDAIVRVASDGTAFTYGQTRDALQALSSGTDINYEGASGTLDFHPDLSVPSKFYVDEVKWDAAANKGSFSTLSAPVVLR